MYNQLCVWPGTMLGDESVENFEKFFADSLGVRVKFAEEVITNPDLDADGNPVPDTGGRHDILFYVEDEDVAKFAVPRFQLGVRWWEDVVKYNEGSYLYSSRILETYPAKW